MAQTTTFQVPLHHHLLAASITRPDNQPDLKPRILVLHGSGDSNQTRSLYLAEHFASKGMATLRFDQMGHGVSTGHARTSSLNFKLEEARAMLPYMQQPIHVIGSSMGANTACLLLPHAKIASLTFIAPAIYGAPHHTVPFGPDFQFFLTLPGFWRSSPCWNLLKEYTGKFLLVTAGREERVSPEVEQLLVINTPHSQRTQLHFPQSDHGIQLYLDKNPAEKTRFLEALTQTILG